MHGELSRLEGLMESDPQAFTELLQKIAGKMLIPHSVGQREVLEAEERFLVLCAGRRWGKALRVDEEILTPQGWRQNGSLRVGDEVIGADGKPTRIRGVYPQGYKQSYKVTFTDGAWVECCADHLWEVYDRKNRKHVKPLRELVDDYLVPRLDGKLEHRYRIPLPVPADFDGGGSRPVDPYALGAILGDGGTTQGSVIFTSADPSLVEEVAAAAGTRAVKYNSPYGYGLTTPRGQRNPLMEGLRELGVMGLPGHEKHVPAAYKVAPAEVRLAILQGLLDTDGNPDRSRFEFSSCSLQLAHDVQYLIRSLGGIATMRIKPTYRRDAYVIRGRLPSYIDPFRLARKMRGYFPSDVGFSRRIARIEPTEPALMQCIEVENDDGLFVTKDFIVTHNSKIGAAKAIRVARRSKKQVWWVAPTYKVVKRGYAEVINQLPPDLLSKPAPADTAFDAGRAVRLEFRNGSTMEFYSAERHEGMLGGSCDFLIMDEAATMPESVWTRTIRATLADRQGKALFISTPRGRNWFYYLWLRGQDELDQDYRSWHFPSRTNPTIPAAEFDEMAEELPQVEYEQEILAQFVSDAASVFRLPKDEEGNLTCVRELVDPVGHVVLGIDLAKHSDYTVLTGIRSADRLPCYHDRFNQVSWPMQRARIHAAVEEIGQTAEGISIFMDVGGPGDVVYDDLIEEGLDIVPINFTKWKEMAVKLLASDLEQGRAFIHQGQLSEFQHYAYKITAAGRWRYEAARGHDDEVSAALLAHWGMTQEGVPSAHTLSVDVHGTGGEDFDWYGEPTTDGLIQEEAGPVDFFAAPTTQQLLANPDLWR